MFFIKNVLYTCACIRDSSRFEFKVGHPNLRKTLTTDKNETRFFFISPTKVINRATNDSIQIFKVLLLYFPKMYPIFVGSVDSFDIKKIRY